MEETTETHADPATGKKVIVTSRQIQHPGRLFLYILLGVAVLTAAIYFGIDLFVG